MIRSLWLLFVYLAFLGLGVTTPFIMTLGYVWVDTFRPQEVAQVILNEMPVALIMGGGAVLGYFALDRRSPPPLTLLSVLQVLMVVWMTATLAWAEVPDRAWVKWDWAFKAGLFAAFLPLVIRSRVQIEAFAQVWVFSLTANAIPFGLKGLISGGGYGQNLGLLSGNTGLAEGGYLSTVCLMAVPLALFLGKQGQLIPRIPLMPLAYLAVSGLLIITALGTYERSALIGLLVLAIYMFMRSRRKILFLVAGVAVAATMAGITADSWTDRISTIGQFKTESSALGRLLVWEWTYNYALAHPLGGSFDAYVINSIVYPPDAANPGGFIQFGRAFHSIYFEVLGETGWPGLFLFLLTAVTSVVSLRKLSKKCRKQPDLAWVADMSNAVQTGLLVFLSAGAFVGLAFQPPFWYFVSMAISLRAYVWHVERAEEPDVALWRRGRKGQGGAVSSGWRARPASVGAASTFVEPAAAASPRSLSPGTSLLHETGRSGFNRT